MDAKNKNVDWYITIEKIKNFSNKFVKELVEEVVSMLYDLLDDGITDSKLKNLLLDFLDKYERDIGKYPVLCKNIVYFLNSKKWYVNYDLKREIDLYLTTLRHIYYFNFKFDKILEQNLSIDELIALLEEKKVILDKINILKVLKKLTNKKDIFVFLRYLNTKQYYYWEGNFKHLSVISKKLSGYKDWEYVLENNFFKNLSIISENVVVNMIKTLTFEEILYLIEKYLDKKFFLWNIGFSMLLDRWVTYNNFEKDLKKIINNFYIEEILIDKVVLRILWKKCLEKGYIPTKERKKFDECRRILIKNMFTIFRKHGYKILFLSDGKKKIIRW